MAIDEVRATGGLELPPGASMLMQSLSSVGYTTAAALADLVDNSIATRAQTVRICMAMTPHPFVAIVDDGTGMDQDTLVNAMRFDSNDPRNAREANDFGRFGLGLKTASLSQCRRLTVATLQGAQVFMARRDLEECDRRGTWRLQRPDWADLPQEPLAILKRQGRGRLLFGRNWTGSRRPEPTRPCCPGSVRSSV